MAKKNTRKEESKIKLDLNNDGKFDEKDKSLAGKVLKKDIEKGNKEMLEMEVEGIKAQLNDPKLEGKVAKVDINLKYRQGDLVPQSQIEQWKSMGIDYQIWFD